MMQRRHAYLLGAVAATVVSAALVVVVNNFYWGASAAPGGEYYLFRRTLPNPLGAVLWAVVKPLVFIMPLVAAWTLYQCVRSWRARHAMRACRTCGYDLTGNVSGVCPECGAVASRT